ncbi:MAG: glycosyltransferase family 39 protein [Planctomycetes bacterium]|nr:glycosyltransferase family 39 protein [Planctomycetota bacterium]
MPEQRAEPGGGREGATGRKAPAAEGLLGTSADVLSILCVLVLGALLGWNELGDHCYTDPEVRRFLDCRSPLAEWTGKPEVRLAPLYPTLLRMWTPLGSYGPSEAVHRSLSVLLGLGALVAAYFVGLRLCDRRVGLLAALLYALAPLRVLEDRSLSPSSCLALLACGSTLALRRALAARGTPAFLPYVALVAAGALTHPAFAAVPLAHLVWVLARWPDHRLQGGTACGAIFVAGCAWLPAVFRASDLLLAVFLPRLVHPNSNLLVEGGLRLLYGLQALALGETIPLSQAPLAAFPLAAFGLALASGLRASASTGARAGPLFGAWVLFSLTGMACTPSNYPTVAAVALPAACLLAAHGLLHLRQAFARLAVPAVLVGGCVLSLANAFDGNVRYFHNLGRVEQFRDQALQLRQAMKPGDFIFKLHPDPGFFTYYVDNSPVYALRKSAGGKYEVEREGKVFSYADWPKFVEEQCRGLWVLSRLEAGRLGKEATFRDLEIENSFGSRFHLTMTFRNFSFGEEREVEDRDWLSFMDFEQPRTKLWRYGQVIPR